MKVKPDWAAALNNAPSGYVRQKDVMERLGELEIPVRIKRKRGKLQAIHVVGVDPATKESYYRIEVCDERQ